MMRKTITILGYRGSHFSEVMETLMKQNLRLLFVSEDEAKYSDLKSRLEQTKTVAEVEFTSCERDGCWEADIIVLTQPYRFSSSLFERIKEVATQKIVLGIYENKENLENSEFQQVLPHSKVVLLLVDLQKKEFSSFGKYPEARSEAQELLSGVGFQMQQ